MKKFSKAELAKFDGQNGQPAYVAVDGTVYDVSGKDAWKGRQTPWQPRWAGFD